MTGLGAKPLPKDNGSTNRNHKERKLLQKSPSSCMDPYPGKTSRDPARDEGAHPRRHPARTGDAARREQAARVASGTSPHRKGSRRRQRRSEKRSEKCLSLFRAGQRKRRGPTRKPAPSRRGYVSGSAPAPGTRRDRGPGGAGAAQQRPRAQKGACPLSEHAPLSERRLPPFREGDAYFRSTRSFSAMRRRNAAMSQRTIWS